MQMTELEIDSNPVNLKDNFLINQIVQLVIDGHNNKKRDIEPRIS